ncbi:TonB-dependent receptor domain-containing protein [Novosphingobium humi]|uniref:TonB-dependent receptor domain-containing protein n=1 Tax=Novosphingobium humi TaxID=2282397 RepID=UPI0025B17E65|nr:TonB-dependent receptor [Novosphingobium humi]WJS98134.1 TonB-dependent receptor [Novosphingobium humi]
MHTKNASYGAAYTLNRTGSFKRRAPFLIGAALLLPMHAQAQTTSPEPTPAAKTEAADIVVTATRIARDGYTAPTPTTVVGQEFVQQRAMVNIGDALNAVPAFRAAVSPNAGGIGNTGAFLADLRGLGSVRTLVLLDRARMPQTIIPGVTTSAGTTDLNVIPTVLIKTSDVVTGGASAAYGSDAVAGVINFQIDDRFVGLKGSAQYSQTRYNDAKDKFATLAYGTKFAGGRGHLVIGGEYNDDGGTAYYNTARAWGREAWGSQTITNRPAGTANTIVGPNGGYFGTATSGGLILTAGALKGLAFVPTASGGVTTTTFSPGLSNMTSSLDFFTPAALAANAAAGINNLNTQQLRPAQIRYNVMGKLTFDVNDNITAYVEPLYSNVKTTGIIIIRRDGAGAGPALNIAKDNAYLAQALTPAQLALVPAGGLSIGYSGQDFGPSVRSIQNELIRVQTGLKGQFGDKWKWDASYLFGQNTSHVAISNTFKTANFRNALDAVSVGGQIVCRNAAAVAAGCVPINILGKANVSAAAASYILGTSTGSGKTGLHDLSANIQGEPFSTWAGPVSIGVGAEYRRESVRLNTDALSQSSGWLTGTGAALPTVSQTVKEAYVETIVPLLRDASFAKKLDFNGAARVTDYSTSGRVTTWKAGLTWEPVDGLLFRSTRSRDIRAPNLIELYTPQTQSLPLPTDPRRGVAAPTNTAGFIVGGNTGLKPEISITQTAGVSWQPSFLRNLRLSVDYYDIRIEGAITSTSTQGVVNNCFIGGTYTGNSWCSLISFANNDPVAGQMTGVRGVTANVASFKTRGLDIQATYRQSLEEIGLHGNLTANMMATHVMSFWSSTDISTLFPNGIDRAGQTGASFGGPAGLPKWLINTSLDYEVGRFGANANIRYVSPSRQNNGLFGPDQAGYDPNLTTSISNNNIPAVAYVDIGMRYSFGADKQYTVFFNINNLFDRDPPLPANGSAYYDLMGRTFKGGARFRF